MIFTAVIRKDIKRILADRKALIVNLGLPLLLTAIMGFSFGAGGDGQSAISAIPIAMVAEDLPLALREQIAESLRESGYFKVTWTDTTEAATAVRDGNVAAAVVLPSDLFTRLLDGQEVAVRLWKDPGSPLKAGIVQQILERGILRYQAGAAAYEALWPEDRAQSQAQDFSLERYLAGDFNDVWQRFRRAGEDTTLQSATDHFLTLMDHQVALSEALSVQLVELKVNDKSTLAPGGDESNGNLFNYFLPSFAVFFLMFTVAGGARDLHREREQLTLQRQLLTPLGSSRFIVGKWVAGTLQGTLQLGVLFVAGAVLFQVNLGPDPYSLALTILLTSAAGAGFFLFMALITPTEKVMDNLSTVVILVSAMIGGNFMPIDSMPAWAHVFGRFVFNYWANLGFSEIVVRNGGLGGVAVPLLVLSSAALTLFALNVMIFTARARRGGLV